MIKVTRHPERGFLLEADMTLPRSREDVFPFFADAFNLERITPPTLKFEILTPPPIDMDEGAVIDYRLRVRGFPVTWKTLISAWEPPHRFVDEALKSPYRWWRHEHIFEDCDDGVRCLDRVHYGVLGGGVANSLFVRRELIRIFEFRQEALFAELATEGEASQFGAEAAKAVLS